jgi:hypothetical protein
MAVIEVIKLSEKKLREKWKCRTTVLVRECEEGAAPLKNTLLELQELKATSGQKQTRAG